MDKPFFQILETLWNNALARRDGYSQIPTSLFVSRIDVNMPAIPAMDLFTENPDGTFKLLRAHDQPYSPLALSVQRHVWIRDRDLRSVKLHAESQALSPERITAPGVPAEQRVLELRQTAIRVIDDLFDNPTQENIQRSNKVVSSFVYLLMKDPKAYLLLSKLSSHDPYTLQHSVGTSVAAIILGKKVGITEENDLNSLGLAALLHDIGKTTVSREIINKNGPLDEGEWEEMKQHASEGYRIIHDIPDIDERTKRAVLEHHEGCDGAGYPQGLKADQIHLFSKIVSICDIFNGLTTDRTYSKARSPFEAFRYIRDNLHGKVDDSVFKQLVLIYGGAL